MKTLIFLILVATCQLTTVSPAHAQEAENSRGVELNDRGVEAFQGAQFAEAARFFAQAYELVGDSAIRKNEAIAWFKAEQCEPAVAAANKFLMLDGTLPGDRLEVTTIVANCKVEFAANAVEAGDNQLAEDLLTQAEALKPDAHVRDQIALVRLEIAKSKQAAKTAAVDTTATDTTAIDTTATDTTATNSQLSTVAPQPRPRMLEWSLIGAGGGIVIAGIVYHAVALGWQADFLDMAARGGESAEFDSLRKRVHTARLVVPILYSLGALTAATGVGLLVAFEPAQASTVSQKPGRVWLGFTTEF